MNFAKFFRTPFFTEHLWTNASDAVQTYDRDLRHERVKYDESFLYSYFYLGPS